MGGGIGGNFGNTRGMRSNAKIHEGRQNKHIKGTNNYKQQLDKGESPSILTENPHKLLRESAGKGKMITPTKESFDFKRKIGRYYDQETKRYFDTSRVTIHYDSKGNAHIVPARPRGF